MKTYKKNPTLLIVFLVFFFLFTIYLFYHPSFLDEKPTSLIMYIFCAYYLFVSVHKVEIDANKNEAIFYKLGRKKQITLSKILKITEGGFYFTIVSGNEKVKIDSMFPDIREIITTLKSQSHETGIIQGYKDYRLWLPNLIEYLLRKIGIDIEQNPNASALVIILLVIILSLLIALPSFIGVIN